MTSGHGYNKNKYTNQSVIQQDTDSDDNPSSKSKNRHSLKTSRPNQYARLNSEDPDNMTLELVRDLKDVIQRKLPDQMQMTESKVEVEVANLRCSLIPEQCNFTIWKRNLPRDIQHCSSAVLHASMAYGNSPVEVKSVIETKMNEEDDDEDPTETSLDNITDPLRKLKRELDKNKLPNLFSVVHSFGNAHVDRVNRLFYSEAYHITGGLKGYTFADAQNAVQAISETDYETNDSRVLLCVIKTLQDVEDVRDYLQMEQSKSTDRNKSPEGGQTSSEDESPSIVNTSKSNKRTTMNDTSTFHYKPLDNPLSSKPSVSASGRSENRPQGESANDSQRRRPARK